MQMSDNVTQIAAVAGLDRHAIGIQRDGLAVLSKHRLGGEVKVGVDGPDRIRDRRIVGDVGRVGCRDAVIRAIRVAGVALPIRLTITVSVLPLPTVR